MSYNPLTDLVPIVQIADVPERARRASVARREEFRGVRCLREGQSGQAELRLDRHRNLVAPVRLHAEQADWASKLTHIPYKGADALNDLLAGRLQFMFATIPSVIQHIQAGKLLPIAMSSAKRSRSLPDVPTVIESGLPGFEAGSWFGFFAPKGTPEPVIAQLNRTVNEILAMPSIEKQMISRGRRSGRRHASRVRPVRAARVREVEAGRARIGRNGRVNCRVPALQNNFV